MSDDLDQLTKNVRVKKLEELIKRKIDEYIERSENQKKIPTPAYRIIPHTAVVSSAPAAAQGTRANGDANEDGKQDAVDGPVHDGDLLYSSEQHHRSDGSESEHGSPLSHHS